MTIIAGFGEFRVIKLDSKPVRYNVEHEPTGIPAIRLLRKQNALDCARRLAEMGICGKTVKEVSASARWAEAKEMVRNEYGPKIG